MLLKSLFAVLALSLSNAAFGQAVLVKDINPGAGNGVSQYRERFVALGGKLFFPGNDGQNGEELWVSDGTTGGTVMLKDIYPGGIGSQPQNLAVFNGKVYFSADDDVHGVEVWVTDGTPAGTQLYKDFEDGMPGSSVDFIGTANGKLLIRATLNSTLKLWATDGPADNLVALANADYGFSSQKNIAVGAYRAFFVAPDNALWVTDGSPAGTQKLKDSPSFFAYYSHMTVIGDKLFYGFGSGSYGTEPWVSDGSEAGTFLLKEMLPGEFDGGSPTYFIEYKGLVYFRGLNQLWRTDGTVNGTALFKSDVAPFGNINFDGREGIVFNNTLFFAGDDDSANGEELWSSDGSLGGTKIFKSINAGFFDAGPSLLVNGGDGNFYFNAYTGNSDYALWKSNGTAAGTVKVADPYPGDNAQNLWAIVPAGNTLFYVTSSAANGNELWKVGITTPVTEPVATPILASVAPNPACGRFQVNLLDSEASTVVRLFDPLGRFVSTQELAPGVSSGELNVEHLPGGRYTLQVQQETGVQSIPVMITR